MQTDYERGYNDAKAGRTPSSTLVLAYASGYDAGYRSRTRHPPHIAFAVDLMRRGESYLDYEFKQRKL